MTWYRGIQVFRQKKDYLITRNLYVIQIQGVNSFASLSTKALLIHEKQFSGQSL